MFLIMRNLSGNSPMTGLTFSATGLYFFFAFTFGAIGATTKFATDGRLIESGEGIEAS